MVIRKNTESATANPVPAEDADAVEWAVWLVTAFPGLKVAPLDHGEKEARYRMDDGSTWPDLLTDKPDAIRRYDSHYRHKKGKPLNFLVCPGDRYVILDLDRKPDSDGIGFYENLAVEHDDMDTAFGDPTFKVTSPSGGEHRYYAVDEPKSNVASFGSSIDVRGRGGYALCPGSVTANGRYRVNATGEPVIAPLSAWAGTYMRRKGERRNPDDAKPIGQLDHASSIERAREFLKQRPPAIAGEQNAKGKYGDEWTFETCCYLRDFGLTYATALDLLTEPDGWNDRCEPPWDFGPEAERRDDLEVKLGSAYRNAQNRPGERTGDPDVQFGDPSTDAADAPQDISEIAERYEQERGAPAETAEGLANIAFRGASISRRNERREMIVPQWLLAHGLTTVNAKRGTGKSLLLLDLACNIALKVEGDGRTWMGQPIADGWKVVYICAEDDVGFEENLRAWMLHHGEEPPEDRFIAMAGKVDLLSADSVKTWTQFLYDNFSKEKTVVIVDTWQRASMRGGQNKDEDMNMAVHHLEAMAKSLGGPAVTATHPTKQGDLEDPLGSSVIGNATSVMWSIQRIHWYCEVEVLRMKGKGEGNKVSFDVKEVKLGELDNFNLERSGAIAKHIGGMEGAGVGEQEAERVRSNEAAKRQAWADALVWTADDAEMGSLDNDLTEVPLRQLALAMHERGLPIAWEERDRTGQVVEQVERVFTNKDASHPVRMLRGMFQEPRKVDNRKEYQSRTVPYTNDKGELRELYTVKHGNKTVIKSRKVEVPDDMSDQIPV